MDKTLLASYALRVKLDLIFDEEEIETILTTATTFDTRKSFFEYISDEYEILEIDYPAAKVGSDAIYKLGNDITREKNFGTLKNICKSKKLDQTKIYSILKENGYIYNKMPSTKAFKEDVYTSECYTYGDEPCVAILWDLNFITTLLDNKDKTEIDKSSTRLKKMPTLRNKCITEIEKRVKEIRALLEPSLNEKQKLDLDYNYFHYIVYEADLYLWRIDNGSHGPKFNSTKKTIIDSLDKAKELAKPKNRKELQVLTDETLQLLQHFESKFHKQ